MNKTNITVKVFLLTILTTGLMFACSDTVSSDEDSDQELMSIEEAEQEVLEWMKEQGFFQRHFLTNLKNRRVNPVLRLYLIIMYRQNMMIPGTY